MLSEELSTDMDRITQLQDAILDLLTLTHTSIEYITAKAALVSPSPDIPVYLIRENQTPRAEYQRNITESVTTIVRRSKDVQTLIAALPKKDDSEARAERLRDLQAEMVVADREYLEALEEAENLLERVQSTLTTALEVPIAQDPSLAPLVDQLRSSTVTSGPGKGTGPGRPPDKAPSGTGRVPEGGEEAEGES